MALTHATFIATYPEFASVSEGYFALWKAEAALELDAATWGTRYDSAQGLLIGHYLTRFPEGSGAASVAGGAIASANTGGMSVSFAQVTGQAGDDGALMATAYGQRFLRLQRQTLFTAMVV